MKEKVVVALSGGVDSSVAAALALEAGCEVVGATLRLKHPDPAFSGAQLCASEQDEAAIAQVVGTIAAPLRGLVTVLSGPQRNFVTVLSQIKDKKEETAA